MTRISRRELKKSKGALPCSVALAFFCASHPRWRCHFQLFQPLCAGNATFAHGKAKWHSHAWWRSLFSVLPVLGGVAIFNICDPSAARMPILDLDGRHLRYSQTTLAHNKSCSVCSSRLFFQLLCETSATTRARNINQSKTCCDKAYGSTRHAFLPIIMQIKLVFIDLLGNIAM